MHSVLTVEEKQLFVCVCLYVCVCSKLSLAD